MNDRKWERWGALGGVLFVVLAAISAFLPGSPPMTSDSAKKISDFFVDHGDEVRWAGYIGALAVIPFFWWLGSVWRMLRRAEGGSPRLTVMATTSAAFATVLAVIGGVILSAVPIIGIRALGLSGARTFYVISTNLAVATLFGVATFLLAFSVVIIRTAVLPRIMGWLGVLIAIVGMVGAASVATDRSAIFDIAFGSFLASMLWILVVSILMFVRAGSAVEADMVAGSSTA
jgi:hypothetical protein